MSDEQVNSVGRPTLYKPEYAELAHKFCLLGADDKRLAEFFDVCEKTINTWKHEYPEFLQSIKRGKFIADAEIANALYHRAKGYSHPSEKIFCHEGIIIVKDYVEHYPPDTAANIIWLKNRQPALWRDKVQTELSGPDSGPVTFSIAIDRVNAVSDDTKP